jgi:hypothetical protein
MHSPHGVQFHSSAQIEGLAPPPPGADGVTGGGGGIPRGANMLKLVIFALTILFAWSKASDSYHPLSCQVPLLYLQILSVDACMLLTSALEYEICWLH